MGLKQKLKEAIFGIPKEEKPIKEGSAVIGTVKQVVSTGIFTTMNEDYTTRLPNHKGEEWNAKEAIDYWNKKNNLDEKILQIAIELTAFGNSFWYIGDNGFTNIPIEAVLKTKPISKTVPVQEKYNIQLTGSYGSKEIKHDQFIHFKVNTIGSGAFGTGVIAGLLEKPDSNTPSLYDIRKSVRASMKTGFEKFSFGNELWVFEGLSDDKIEEIGKKITEMSNTGNRIATNVRGDIRLSVPQRTQSYDRWLETIENEFLTALANPSLKMGPERGWITKASAETAAAMFEYKIAAMRRTIKRQIEALWCKVLDELGFDSEKADIRLNFGAEEIKLDFEQVLAAVQAGIISREEARKYLIKIAKIELSSEEVPEEAKVLEEAKSNCTTDDGRPGVLKPGKGGGWWCCPLDQAQEEPEPEVKKKGLTYEEKKLFKYLLGKKGISKDHFEQELAKSGLPRYATEREIIKRLKDSGEYATADRVSKGVGTPQDYALALLVLAKIQSEKEEEEK